MLEPEILKCTVRVYTYVPGRCKGRCIPHISRGPLTESETVSAAFALTAVVSCVPLDDNLAPPGLGVLSRRCPSPESSTGSKSESTHST